MLAYEGRVSFQDLAFAYPDNQTPIFESLKVDLEPGAVLIVAGGNGTGKTTLSRLVVGLIEPTRGRILVDGLELQQVAPEWWRMQVSYLPQEPSFLNATISENLKIANPQADDAAVNAAINAVTCGAISARQRMGLKPSSKKRRGPGSRNSPATGAC